MIKYSKITFNDYGILTHIMTNAFNTDTKMHTNLIEDGPCGYNDGTLIKKLATSPKYITQKILYNNKIIGAFSIYSDINNTFFLELLFISPEYNNLNLGTSIWNYIETTYTNAKKWIVETPSYSKRNHYFYINKCGFKFSHQKFYDKNSISYVFEKYTNSSS